MMSQPLEIETRVETVSVQIADVLTSRCSCCQQTEREAFHLPRTALSIEELCVVLVRIWNAHRNLIGLKPLEYKKRLEKE